MMVIASCLNENPVQAQFWILDCGFWPALPVPIPGRDREARLIRFEPGDPIFSSLNDPFLMPRITRSEPGIQKRKKFQCV